MKEVTANELVYFRTDFKYERIEIHFGIPFLYSKQARRIQLNIAPDGDTRLVPIDLAEIVSGRLRIGAHVRGQAKSFEIRFQNCPFGHSFAEFLTTVVGRTMDLDKQKDDIELKWEPGFCQLRISDIDRSSLSFFPTSRRASHLYRRSDGLLKPDLFTDAKVSYFDGTLILRGTPENSCSADPVEWKLDFHDEMRLFTSQLIGTCSDFLCTPEPLAASHASDLSRHSVPFIPSSAPAGTNAQIDKEQLEELIAAQKTIGEYSFDALKGCFVTDTEIVLYITKVGEGRYRGVCYFLDGYEVFFDDKEIYEFSGDEESAKRHAIDSFNRETFMNYPVVYSNVTCNLYEDEA